MTTTEIPGYVTGKWAVDTAHSDVAYTVKHLGLAKSRGNFTGFTGTVVTEPNILDSSVTVEISAASVTSVTPTCAPATSSTSTSTRPSRSARPASARTTATTSSTAS